MAHPGRGFFSFPDLFFAAFPSQTSGGAFWKLRFCDVCSFPLCFAGFSSYPRLFSDFFFSHASINDMQRVPAGPRFFDRTFSSFPTPPDPFLFFAFCRQNIEDN